MTGKFNSGSLVCTILPALLAWRIGMNAVTRPQHTLPGFRTSHAVNPLFVLVLVSCTIFAGLNAGLEEKQRLVTNRLSRSKNERNLYLIYSSKEYSPCPL
jgi:hypothetical protein